MRRDIAVTHIKTGIVTLKDILECEDVIETEESEKYLGDIVINNGKIDKNIIVRENWSSGIPKDLLASFAEMMVGGELHELGVTFRNAILISSLLSNTESLYNVTLSNIVTRKIVDEQMLSGILNAP